MCCVADGDLFSRICVRKAEGRYFTEDEVMDTFIQVRSRGSRLCCDGQRLH